jgi:glycosyltransferase involved in cell wall biosynthesis
MRAGVDVAPLVQTSAGTARHVRGLLGALRGRPGLELEELTFGGGSRASSVVRDAWWYPFGLARASRRLDVLHCTTFRAPRRPRSPLVVTVHDLALLRHPEAFPVWHRRSGTIALRSAVGAAAAIVAVSEFTRSELVELLDVAPDRIRVVPNGVDPVFAPEGPAAPGDYVLAVSTLEPRKNLGAAVEAARIAGLELRVAGAPGWGGVDVPGWTGRPTDSELAALYRGARCVVYPSLYEGFGLPVLEAMACGTPVVTSRGGATEEIAGGAAVLVDPNDPAGVAAGIGEAARRRAELVPLGLERARDFTWQHAADVVEELWRELS